MSSLRGSRRIIGGHMQRKALCAIAPPANLRLTDEASHRMMVPMLKYARIACAGADGTMVPAAGSMSAGHSVSQLNAANQAKRQIVHSYLVCSSHES